MIYPGNKLLRFDAQRDKNDNYNQRKRDPRYYLNEPKTRNVNQHRVFSLKTGFKFQRQVRTPPFLKGSPLFESSFKFTKRLERGTITTNGERQFTILLRRFPAEPSPAFRVIYIISNT